MGRRKRRFVGLALTGLFLAATPQLAGAEKWKPYQFKGNERFEYKVIWEVRREKKEAFYILEIRSSGRKTEAGEELLEVTYTNRRTMKKQELQQGGAFGLWGTTGVSLHAIILNPLYNVYLSQVDMKVGEKMSFYGALMVKVTGKQKIAGREGLFCQLFQTKKEKEGLTAEWVIDPELPLPLSSKIFKKGKIQGQAELIKYSGP